MYMMLSSEYSHKCLFVWMFGLNLRQKQTSEASAGRETGSEDRNPRSSTTERKHKKKFKTKCPF